MIGYQKTKDSGVDWIGNIPEHWDIRRLKRSTKLATEKASKQDNPIALENIEGWTGCLIKTETKFEGDGIAFNVGDILFGKLRPYLAKAYLADRAGEAVGDLLVLRPEKDTNGKFTQYQILNREFISIVNGSTFGSKMPRTSWEFMGNMPVTAPPIDEQEKIVNFLDREISKIDELIQRQANLITLLNEKCQTLISYAVTKGLNHKVKMRDSGVSWIGEIPMHWESKEIRRVVKDHKQGYYTSEGYQDEGLRLLRITDLKSSGLISYADCPRVNALPETEEFLLKSGDFVFARTGGAGSFGLVEDDHPQAIFASYLIRFRFDESVNTHFLKYLFLSSGFKTGIEMNIHGGVNKNVHAEDIKNQYISTPPLIEQQEIVDYLDIFTRKIQDLIQKSKASIELLKERRSSLISSAVTGKIDVREVA